MTNPATDAGPSHRDTINTAAGTILQLRDHTRSRVALRRAANPATEHQAFPYLVPLWAGRPYLRDPVLVGASLAAEFSRVRHEPGVRFGLAVRNRCVGDPQLLKSLTTRFTLAQTSPLLRARTVLFHPVLSRLEIARQPVDWFSLFHTLAAWDHPNQSVRRRTRQHLLTDLYAPFPTKEHTPS